MFGFPRLRDVVGTHPGGDSLIEHLLGQLDGFTGAGWEQEDDVTLVTLHRKPLASAAINGGGGRSSSAGGTGGPDGAPDETAMRTLTEFTLASEPGNERKATKLVSEAIEGIDLSQPRLEQLKTAVAEATMNAMEHGNQYSKDLPVSVSVFASDSALEVHITDHGGGDPIPEPDTPDLEAKLAGTQTPRGWGLFLIQNMVDDLRRSSDETHHTVELVMHLGGGHDDA